MQTHAFYTIVTVESVRDNLGKQIFIDGPGGTGKSYVYKTAINYLRGQHCKVCIKFYSPSLPRGRPSRFAHTTRAQAPPSQLGGWGGLAYDLACCVKTMTKHSLASHGEAG